VAAVGSYQYVVVNDALDQAFVQVASIIDAETVRHRREAAAGRPVRQLVDGLDREI
jgi:guanylate kinase